MYVDIVPNRHSPPAILLRESKRVGGKIVKRTIANLSGMPMEQVQALRLALKGKRMVPADEAFEIVEGGSLAHGHVQAVATAMKKLKMASLLDTRASRQRDLVLAMVAARLVHPGSKLSTTRWWNTTTLPEIFGVQQASEDELYEAMDWLLERQERIEKKLAKRHLQQEDLVLYDLSSSYVYGKHCDLAAFGYSRDKKRGVKQINYGLLTDAAGCPIAIEAFEGNRTDSTTVASQVDKLRTRFGLEKFVLVGDRGMLNNKQIETLRGLDGVKWITALRHSEIRKLAAKQVVQLGLFDERNLYEVTHPDYPNERLIVCRNPALAEHQKAKRDELLRRTCENLSKVQQAVASGKLKKAEAIGRRVGKVIGRHKMAKHIRTQIQQGQFEFVVDDASVQAEADIDGIYIIRSSVEVDQLDTDDVVYGYKLLTQVERGFRSLKSDLDVRPIYHWRAHRVRAHLLIAMLAYYLEWHLRKAWTPLLFADQLSPTDPEQSPVTPRHASAYARRKTSTKRTSNGQLVHSFDTLLQQLARIVSNTCRAPGMTSTFEVITTPTPTQRQALDLIERIRL